MEAFKCKKSQFSIQPMILIAKEKYSNVNQLHSLRKIAMAFQFSSITRVFISLICSNSIYIFSVLWNQFRLQVWHVIINENGVIFCKTNIPWIKEWKKHISVSSFKIFIVCRTRVKSIRINHSTLKIIQELIPSSFKCRPITSSLSLSLSLPLLLLLLNLLPESNSFRQRKKWR